MAKQTINIPNLKLNDGTSIPMIGYGTGTAWYKSGDESKIDKACIEATQMSLGMGYHHQDCAEMYGTETEVGQAIKASGIAREKLFVTTKLNKDMESDAGVALKRSLKKLGLEYVDLYLIHMPNWSDKKEAHQEKWRQMEALKSQGLTKSIGVSNYPVERLEWILETATVPPAINQIKFHPYLQQAELIEFHKKKGIATEAYSPLSPVTKETGGPADEILNALAKKYAVGPGEICLRWCIDQDIVPITTSGKEQRLSDYLLTFKFKLTPEEIRRINEAGSKKQ